METISADEFKKRYGEVNHAQFTNPQPAQGALQGFGQNISSAFKGGIDQAKQGYQQATQAKNPIDALGAGMKEVAGVTQAAFSPLAPAFEPINKGINYAADKLSDTSLIKGAAGNQIETPNGTQYQPNEGADSLASFLADTSTVLGATAGLGVGPKTGGVTGGPKGPTSTPPPGGGAIPTATAGLTRTVGKTLKAAGEGMYSLTMPAEKATAAKLMAYDAKQPNLLGRIKNFANDTAVDEKPITEANTAARAGLMGTEYGLGVKAMKVAGNIWNKEINPKLSAVKAKTNMSSFLDSVQKEIRAAGGDLTRRNVLTDALKQIRQDYKNVKDINLTKLQDYKEGWAKFIPDASYAGKPIASAIKEVHDIMAQKARAVIYKNIGPEGKQAYIDYGNLQSIIEAGKKSIQGDPAAKSLGRDVWQFVMNKAITPVATVAGYVLYKTGEGIELVGKKGANTVGDIVGESRIIK